MRKLIALGAFALGLFLTIGGGIVMATGQNIEVTHVEYTGEWGFLPAMAGLLILCFTAVVAWDTWK